MKTEPNELIHSFTPSDYSEGNYNGLTKREYMATEFTKAIIIGITTASGHAHHGWSSAEFAQGGLLQADALIDALNNTHDKAQQG